MSGLYVERWSYAVGGNVIIRRNKLNEKAFFDTVGIKIAGLKEEF